MKRKPREEANTSDWLATYSDMVTLLLTFFILLFSQASIDQEKWADLVKSFSRSVNGETAQIVFAPNGTGDDMGTNKGDGAIFEDDSEYIDLNSPIPKDFDELYEYLEKFVQENDMQGSVELQQNENSVFIRFRDNIFFNPDSEVLKQESYKTLDFLGKCLKSIEPQLLAVRINGHTADVGYTDYPVSDRRLSSNRADSVAIYFEDNFNLAGEKIIAMGYGKHFPVATNDTPEGRSQNRRVDMMIMSNTNVTAADSDLYNYLQGLVEIDTVTDTLNGQSVLIPPTPPNS